MKKINGNETVEKDGFIYHQDTNELGTGTVESFHDNGQLFRRSNYIDGLQDGLFEMFHSNGRLFVRGDYIDGEREGLFEWFDEDGNLTSKQTYRNGVRVETNSNP